MNETEAQQMLADDVRGQAVAAARVRDGIVHVNLSCSCAATHGTPNLTIADDGTVACAQCGVAMAISAEDKARVAEALDLAKLRQLEGAVDRLSGDAEALAALDRARQARAVKAAGAINAAHAHEPAVSPARPPRSKDFGPDCPTACGLGCRWHGKHNAKLARRAAVAAAAAGAPPFPCVKCGKVHRTAEKLSGGVWKVPDTLESFRNERGEWALRCCLGCVGRHERLGTRDGRGGQEDDGMNQKPGRKPKRARKKRPTLGERVTSLEAKVAPPPEPAHMVTVFRPPVVAFASRCTSARLTGRDGSHVDVAILNGDTPSVIGANLLAALSVLDADVEQRARGPVRFVRGGDF